MPCYDDRHGNTTRLYVGHLSSRTRSRDLEHIFSRYGRVRDVDMKQDFAFVDFSDPRDADDAIYSLNGREVDGRRIIVELAKGVPRGPGGAREYIGRGRPPGSGQCFNCGLDGHWARDCKAGDWKNKCYRCGERGHVERNCKNSPKKLRHGPSYSRSPVRSHSPRRGRGRSPSYSHRRSHSHSRSRSRSYSRSPPARERFVDRDDWKSRSPYGGSPPPRNDAAPSRSRKRSATPDEGNTRGSESPLRLPKKVRLTEEYDEDIQSPVRRSRSPVSYEREGDAGRRYDDCPFEANGVNGSPGAGEGRSPVDDAEEERSPRGSESP